MKSSNFKLFAIPVIALLVIGVMIYNDTKSSSASKNQSSVVEKTATPEATSSAETTSNPEATNGSNSEVLSPEEYNQAVKDYTQRVKEKTEANERRAYYLTFAPYISILQTEHSGTESLEDKIFLYSDYETGEIDATIDAFEYGKTGSDDYYITYYRDESSNIVGVQYQKRTAELDSLYGDNEITGD